MLKFTKQLTHNVIFNYFGNQADGYTKQCQLYWIAEAIVYAIPKIKKIDVTIDF